MSVTNVPQCTAIMAQSGAGKSTIIKRRFKKMKPSRVAVWSPDEDEDNYAELLGCKVVRTIPELAAEMKKARFKVVFWPAMDKETRLKQFDYFCRMVYSAGNCVALVEELKYVTSAISAPEPWAILSTRGRKKGTVLIGTSQRPTHIDKDFLGNCTEIIAGSLPYPADRKACAGAMRIPVTDLEPLQLLQFVRTASGEEKTAFNLTF